MTTLFAAALQGLGLSQSEAAAHLDISPHNINAMSAGRRPVPAGVWRELHTLAASQDRAARAAADKARRVKDGATIELALARDPDPMNRNCSIMRAARGDNVRICHYFPDMVTNATHEARKMLRKLASIPIRATA